MIEAWLLPCQRLARAADLSRDRGDRRPLRGMLALVVQNHPHRAGTDLRGIWWGSLCHRSILSRVGASGKPGAVQYRLRRETHAETAGWEVPPRAGYTAWCIIRRSDSAAVSYGFPDNQIWDADDEELAALFEGLNKDKA